MEDPIKETFNDLIFWFKAGKADPGSPTYEEARNKVTVKLAVLLVNAIENFRHAMEETAKQSQRTNAVLVRLTWWLVALGVLTVFIGGITVGVTIR